MRLLPERIQWGEKKSKRESMNEHQKNSEGKKKTYNGLIRELKLKIRKENLAGRTTREI